METLTTSPPQRPAPAAITPLLRSVVLCDLVESTALAERIGDLRIAELMQAHDHLLLRLLLDHQGQLIDKADGVLALFERPVNAAAFALAYQRGLRDLGEQLGQPLQARVGIHVGDVMTWTHTPAEVLAGAKPVEVEGLAKPVAARLMSLALPGQILMSGMAQNLAQRAQGELGHIAPKLLWRLHGRYRFKGVPAPMLVHEVGELGIAPLRPPMSTEKAWRELPLWRKPPVLALEAVLAVSLAVGGVWSMLKSPPAIAFSERDWVVVADFNNLTGETLYDEALDTALRVGLEQSRYVNVLSDLQVEDALKRMQREGQKIDRQIGAEIALREGAKALVLPTVAYIGGRPRVTVEVVDPNSGVTVFTHLADASGKAGVLRAMDEVMTGMRNDLGESLASIEKNNVPLEKATTDNLEALRAFALGIQERLAGKPLEAMELFTRAIELDPEFSMAYLRMAAIQLADDLGLAAKYLSMAADRRERLTHRESLLLDASLGLFKKPSEMLKSWKQLATIYPDEYRAYYNFSYFAFVYAQRYEEAAAYITPALAASNPQRADAYFLRGASLLAANRLKDALASFEQSASQGGGSGFKRNHADALAALRQYSEAASVLAEQRASGLSGLFIHERLPEVSYRLDRGRWDEASDVLERWSAEIDPEDSGTAANLKLIHLALRSYLPDTRLGVELRDFIDARLDAGKNIGPIGRQNYLFELLAAGWIATKIQDTTYGQKVDALLGEEAIEGGYPATSDMALILRAELMLARGDSTEAIELLRNRASAGDELYFLHVSLLRAYLADGQLASAAEQAEWIAQQRGRAFGETMNNSIVWQPINVVESNLALVSASHIAERMGRKDESKRLAKEFELAWPDGNRVGAVARRLSEL